MLSKIEAVRFGGAVAGVQGVAATKLGAASVRITVDSSFPASLPKVYLVPWNAFGFRPHIDRRGLICWQDDATTLVDFESPLQILEETLLGAVKLLETELSEEQTTLEFAEEFPSYWRDQPRNITAHSCVRIDGFPRRIYFREGKKNWFEDQSIEEFFRHQSQPKGQRKSALFLKLKCPIRPPSFDALWSGDEVRNLIYANATEETKAFLKEESSQKWKRGGECFLLIAFPNPKGGSHAFGLRLNSFSDKHPLADDGKCTVTAVNVDRVDRNYILPRGGANSIFFEKKVLLIGAGSLGSHTAIQLAQSGIGFLTIVDHDSLNSENLFRHLLGIDDIDRFKVNALKSSIEKKLPYIKVNAEPLRVEEFVRKNKSLDDYDLVISTIGAPSVERWLNSFVQEKNIKTPFIYSWLEPMGIGGHVLLTNNQAKVCCFECLFDSSNLYNRASFAHRENPPFSRTYLGCSGRFVPFGILDSIRTSELLVRTVVRLLGGQERGNPLYSWKGDSAEFVAAGYKVSDRFANLSGDDLFARRFEYKIDRCSVCG